MAWLQQRMLSLEMWLSCHPAALLVHPSSFWGYTVAFGKTYSHNARWREWRQDTNWIQSFDRFCTPAQDWGSSSLVEQQVDKTLTFTLPFVLRLLDSGSFPWPQLWISVWLFAMDWLDFLLDWLTGIDSWTAWPCTWTKLTPLGSIPPLHMTTTEISLR